MPDLRGLRTCSIALALLTGCRAERELTITSDPPGAEVRLEDRVVGVTPLELEFVHYGTRRLTLRKDGYLPWSRPIEVKPPWYARFPWDIFSEVFFPVGWHDEHAFNVELEAGVERVNLPDLRTVLDRADALRRAGPDGPRNLPPPLARPAVRQDAPASDSASDAEPNGSSSEPR